MDNNTPSSRRREGRNAFEPGLTDSEALAQCPYRDSYSSEDWMDGWHEEQATFDSQQEERDYEQEERDDEQEEFDLLACQCPWHENGDCQGRITDVYLGGSSDCGCCETKTTFSYESCYKEGCPSWHFKQN